ncbi:MAG: response regulator transcription factor [Candidatus Tectimicrobiota bacterium]
MKKVLVVDDSLTDLTNIKNIVTEAGCLVFTATNGQEALEKARAEKPDLIFLDIVMPEQDGFGTCRKLAHGSDTKEIPVVFVSSKNQKADRLWAQMQGAKGYITKPYSPQEILAQLQALA